ncbi:MAG: translation initiation factor IF-2 [Patescibacteria group bacterium]
MSLQTRPPIITIMGHVDHGKTSLLDYIRKTNVQAREAGGITQHIGAYQIDFQGSKITFIDTPGHAAFNKMRQRGAKVTDIVVLVVAANDGVKPQTIESIRYIKESKVPFIVAINKTDIEGVRPDDVKAQLAEHEVLVRDFGGEVDTVLISAKTGKGVDELLENLALMTEMLELKADPDAPLKAVVIESAKDDRKGVLARVIVKQGTLRVRQDVFADKVEGRIRALNNERGEVLESVGPGSPAEIVGLKDVPEVGLIVMDAAADYSSIEVGESQLESTHTERELGSSLSELDFDSLLSDQEKLKLIVRTDVKGTLEAVMQNIDSESVELLAAGVGNITEQDIELAATSGAKIIAFHIKVSRQIKELARRQGVRIKEYDIIYHLIEDLQKQMLKLMEPTIDEVVTGEGEIVQVFEMKGERIAGIKVKTGELKKHDWFHLKRGEEIIANPVVKSMKHGKDDILVVKTKNEAGLTFKNKSLDFRVGDLIVAYKKEDELL